MIVLSGLFIGALSFAVLVGTQKNFRANSDLLVAQNQNGFSDYYALSKSADYLAGVLIEAIYSEKFLEEVEATGTVSESFLPENKLERLEEWNRIVKVGKNSNTGMVSIQVFGDTQKQVMEISNAILNVLTTKNYLFLGKGQDIDIRILSGPLYEKNPSIANILLASGGGFLVGVILSLMRIFYQAEYGRYRNIISIKDFQEEPYHPEEDAYQEEEQVAYHEEAQERYAEPERRELTPEEITERNAMEYWRSKNRQ